MSRSHIGFPSLVDVRCPRCGGRALFDTHLFDFYPERKGKPPASDRPVHRWNDCHVIERYPMLVPWTPPPPRGAAERYNPKRGVIKCTSCHLVVAHQVNWPDDAYYRWDVRGITLWAWSEEHARALLGFIESAERDPMAWPGPYRLSLRNLPRQVVLAKSCSTLAKLIRRTLEGDRP